MPYVRDSFWRGRDFTSLEAMQAEALRWAREVAGTRACRALDGAAPAAVFAAVEAPALRPLPRTPFVLATWSTGKVGPDIHAKVGPALYSVPWRLIGQRVHARSTAATVQIVHEATVVATHVRAERGRRTNFDHYPPEKIAFHLRTPAWCRDAAAAVGPACTEVIAALLADNALFRLRAAQGVLALGEKHTPARLEAACAKALAVGDPSYRTVKGVLLTGTETTPDPAAGGGPSSDAAGVPAFLHGPDRLFTTEHPQPDRPAGAVVLPLPTTATRTTTATTTTGTTASATTASATTDSATTTTGTTEEDLDQASREAGA